MTDRARICFFAVMLGLISLATACGDDEEGALPDVDCTGTKPAYDDVTAFKKCTTCHSSKLSGAARNEAPTDINFDTEPAAEAHAEKAASEVNEGAMPPKDSGLTLTSDEKTTLYKWALCD
jgi:uncharacterized membrane protein